jgi:type IV secretory pathway TrbD component
LAVSRIKAEEFTPEEFSMTYQRRINPVHRSLSRPLTILGAERKLFFFAMCLGAATFNLLGSLLGGVLMFFLLYLVARWATRTDPQILRFLLTAARLRAQYDPMKFSAIEIRRDAHAQAKPNL